MTPANERHRGGGLMSTRTQLSLFICCAFVPLMRKKNCCHGSTHCISTEGARLFFLVLFSTFSLKCPSWEGGPSLPSLNQVPAVTRSHCLIHESFFFLIYVPDAFWQKKKQTKVAQLQLVHPFAALRPDTPSQPFPCCLERSQNSVFIFYL